MKGHVVVCGLGHVGFRCFELLDVLGFKVAIITEATSPDWQRRVEESGGQFLLGDARSDQLLLRAGIRDACAVLAVTDRDLVNVSVVMDARRLNPGVRIVCRLFDSTLGKYIAGDFDVAQVFSTSELATPVFTDVVSSGLPGVPSANVLHVAGEDALNGAALLECTETGELRRPRGAEHVADGLFLRGIALPTRRAKDSIFLRPVRAVLAPGLSKLRAIALFISAVILSAAFVIRSAMSLSWIDSIYFVTSTVTTVGYGDYNFSGRSAALKAFGILLMLVGATSLGLLFSAVAEAFLSERLSSLFGGRPVPRRGHVVLVGAGHIGTRVVEHLVRQGVPVVVVEDDRNGATRFPADAKRTVAVVEGDPRSLDTLERARIGKARAVICVSDDDVQNLSVAIAAQTANPAVRAVVRVFDADLASKLGTRLVGQRLLSVSGNAAPYFVAAILGENVRAAARWQGHLVFLATRALNPTVKTFGTCAATTESQELVVCAVPFVLVDRRSGHPITVPNFKSVRGPADD